MVWSSSIFSRCFSLCTIQFDADVVTLPHLSFLEVFHASLIYARTNCSLRPCVHHSRLSSLPVGRHTSRCDNTTIVCFSFYFLFFIHVFWFSTSLSCICFISFPLRSLEVLLILCHCQLFHFFILLIDFPVPIILLAENQQYWGDGNQLMGTVFWDKPNTYGTGVLKAFQ